MPPMLPLLTDEDLQSAIVTGLLLHFPDIDLVRVQDVGLMRTPDPVILEYAATQNRVIVTHDRNTMNRSRARPHEPGNACTTSSRTTGRSYAAEPTSSGVARG